MKSRLIQTAEKALYALEVAVFVSLLVVCVGGIYTYGMMHGELIGEGRGYRQCQVDTIFPSKSEIEKLTDMVEAID